MSEEMKNMNVDELEEISGGQGGTVSGWKSVKVTGDTCLRRSCTDSTDGNVICKVHAGEYIRLRVDGPDGAEAEGSWVAARVGHNEGFVDKASVSYQDCLVAKTTRANRFGGPHTTMC